MKKSASISQSSITTDILNFLKIFRGLLWLGLIPLIVICDDWLRNTNHQGIPTLIIILALPISFSLAYITVKNDIKYARLRRAFEIYKNVRDESNNLPLHQYIPINNSHYQVSKEYFWDNKGDIYKDIFHYLDVFPNRNDHIALKMQRVWSRAEMTQLIPLNMKNIQSIRIWNHSNLISLNYGELFPISDIVAFEIINQSMIQRGKGHTSINYHTQGTSFENLIGNYNHKFQTKGHAITTYDPDVVINNYVIYLTVKNQPDSLQKIFIGDSHDLVQRIKSEFLIMGIPYINKL